MANATPIASELWKGIGGHFESLSQILCEFVDNSISNLVSSNSINRAVVIKITKTNTDRYKVSIEDAGTGISDFDGVLMLGNRSLAQSPLNEHGFGLKHALASANPSNNHWRICTKDNSDLTRGFFKEVTSEYKFEYDIVDVDIREWPGEFSGTGTYVEFETSEEMFKTLQSGIRGNALFARSIEYLVEDLGYVYSGVLNNNAVNITVIAKQNDETISRTNVRPILPEWEGYYLPPQSLNVDLGNGNVNLQITIGEMKEGSSARYYKRNMSTSGAEIRINGRLLADNLFKEIWNLENHPSYNHFLTCINLISNIPERLPRTRTSKNGIRSDDPKLQKLFDYIRSAYSTPEKKLVNTITEREFIRRLADEKNRHIRNPLKSVQVDYGVYRTKGGPVLADLYLFDGNDIVLYEAKKNQASVQDFYQLLMYWDGFVCDGGTPTEGILLAPSFCNGVAQVISDFNLKTDFNGNNYNFSMKTWLDEGIEYTG